MEIRRLEHFVAVAETGSFRAAAARLFITQPALSRSVAALERELGAILFDRSAGGTRLTSAGEALRQSAQRILHEAANLRPAVATAGRRVLRIADYGHSLAEMTHLTVSAFAQDHPDVEVHLLEADYLRGVQPVVAGEYDVALLSAPTAVPGLETVPLFCEPVRALLPAGHPLAAQRSVRFAELADLPVVTFPPAIPTAWADYWLGVAHRGGRRPAVFSYARTPAELRWAVAYRGMTAMLPGHAARWQQQPGITSVEVSDMQPAPSAVAYRSDDPPLLAAAFAATALDVARREIGCIPGGTLPPEG